jgi:hypothetical protein
MTKSLAVPFFLFSAISVLIGACAKISAPTGGRRDKLAPVVIKSVPENRAKNFRGKSFAITFNEYVALDNIADKFMVSPPMKKKPLVFIKSKSVIVEFDEKLKDSTTYSFYFQDGIKDLNEGNKLEDYKFVFSTGPVVDSLSVTGNVYNSSDLEVPEKTQVLMYSELADSAVVKHLPAYISRINEYGYFRIDNVRPGIYRLYALKEEDNSKNYNLSDEEFAFLDSTVTVTSEKNFIPVVKDTATIKKKPAKPPEIIIPTGEYQLFLFTGPKKNHYLTGSSRDTKFKLLYTLSLPPDSMKVDFSIMDADKDKYFTEWNRGKDTLVVWLTDSTLYSRQQITTFITYPFTDTLQVLGYKPDTILMRYLAPRAPRVKVRKTAFKIETNITGGALKPGQAIVFNSQTPFRKPDTTLISFYEVMDKERKKVNFVLKKDSLNSCRYYFDAVLQQGKKYFFNADSAAFSNIYNEVSDSIGIKFSINEADSYSKLTLNLFNYQGATIVQLTDKSEKLISQSLQNKEGKVIFPLLESGFYRLRVIYDLNGDGAWTSGDFDSGRQPEPVSYYPGEIEIKKGWEVDQKWDIGTKNIKDQKMRTIKKKQ